MHRHTRRLVAQCWRVRRCAAMAVFIKDKCAGTALSWLRFIRQDGRQLNDCLITMVTIAWCCVLCSTIVTINLWSDELIGLQSLQKRATNGFNIQAKVFMSN